MYFIFPLQYLILPEQVTATYRCTSLKYPTRTEQFHLDL